MMHLNPYLNFNGNTEEAFNFYRAAFGGEFSGLHRFKDTPDAEKLSAADRQKIMHVSLPIGPGHTLMGTDFLEGHGPALVEGNNFSISINTDTEEEATRIFNALSAGGTIEMALNKTFWGALFGMFKDKFGIQWMVNCDLKPAV